MAPTVRRLRAAVVWDARLQWRNGFYYAGIFVAVIYVLLLSQLRPALAQAGQSLAPWLPALVVTNMVVTTFYFMAGLVLLEKGEGTLAAQAVSPLRRGEYLAAKVLSLAGLALAENLVIVTAAVGLGEWAYAGAGEGARLPIVFLIAGMLLLAGLYALYGFIVVVRYASVNEFLMPSVLYTAALSLPLLDTYGLAPSLLWYLHPVQAPILLLRGAFEPLAAWQVVYALVYGGLWLALLFAWSRRRLAEFTTRA
jgi:fluoroquinolone transport system permease protein